MNNQEKAIFSVMILFALCAIFSIILTSFYIGIRYSEYNAKTSRLNTNLNQCNTNENKQTKN